MYDFGYKTPAKSNNETDMPVRKRGCTDILCLLIFLGFWGATGFFLFNLRSTGDFSKIMRPYDGGIFTISNIFFRESMWV